MAVERDDVGERPLASVLHAASYGRRAPRDYAALGTRLPRLHISGLSLLRNTLLGSAVTSIRLQQPYSRAALSPPSPRAAANK